VEQALAKKAIDVVAIEHHRSVEEAVALMVKHHVGSVLVTHDDGKLAGILSERDCVQRVMHARRNPATTLVAEVMTTAFVTVSPFHTLQRCMDLMTRHRVRHLPAIDGAAIIGLVSIGDCVAQLCDDTLRENGQLRDYISGRYPG
jgi:CBS domain-containing protein